MSSRLPISEQSNIQKIMMGLGAALIVVLTVFVAIFLAARDLGTAPAPVDVATDTPIAEPTATPRLATDTPLEPTTNQVDDTPTPFIPTATPLPPTVTHTSSPTPVPPTPTFTATPCVKRTDWYLYYVQVGDTLQSLADKTRTSAEFLRLSNCLLNRNLTVGQPLYLPELPATATPYPTQPPPPTRPPDVDLGTPTPTDPSAPSTEL